MRNAAREYWNPALRDIALRDAEALIESMQEMTRRTYTGIAERLPPAAPGREWAHRVEFDIEGDDDRLIARHIFEQVRVDSRP